ncbi:hypothetical protein [Natronorubrum halophilum]|uniref:hypothetical protein n=1 Tax=Natronorubrum halophilum TaxID=1702106 RepID=UPI000EF70A56|nr:hypothetical protein [Natronorubrum halophilum]
MKGTIWTVTIVAILAGVMFAGVSMQYGESFQTRDVVVEEHTLSDTEPITLEYADEWRNMVNGSEEIRRSNGDVLTRGVDYEINYETGEVTANETHDGRDVEIDYQYRVRDDDTEAISAVVGPLSPLIGLLVLIACGGVLLKWIGMLPSGGGSW